MTTKHSPLCELQRQADKVAATLKAASRGEIEFKKGAHHKPVVVSFAVVMDDKILKIEMAWDTIRQTSEAGISEFILREMRESREAVQ